MRIGFRDNLLYVTLGLYGGIASFAVANEPGVYTLLIIPWVCLVMGWTYVVNDEKITAIGNHIRHTLEDRISNIIEGSADNQSLFSWETAHRDDFRRKSRKCYQLCIDEIAFVLSGLSALVVFWTLVPNGTFLLVVISVLEAGLLLFLGRQIVVYADLSKGRKAN